MQRGEKEQSFSIWCGLCPLGIGHPDARCLVEHMVSSSRVYGMPPLNSYPTWRCPSTGPCPTPGPAHRFLLLVIPWAGSRKEVQLGFLSQNPLGHRHPHTPRHLHTEIGDWAQNPLSSYLKSEDYLMGNIY